MENQHLSEGNKIKYSTFSPNLRSEQIKKCLELLSLARIIYPVSHSSCSGMPLNAGEDKTIYKLLYLDTGLLLKALGLNLGQLSTLTQDSLINKGVIAEHFIGQHLLTKASAENNRTLNYWLREGKVNNAEVDYVIVEKGEVIPIEVKSGKAGKLRSLHQFIEKHHNKYSVRFDLNTPSVKSLDKDNKSILYSLPLYLVEMLHEISLV